MTRTETRSARHRPEVLRTGAVKARVEAEGAAGKVQRRPEADAARQAVELLGVGLSLGLRATFSD